MSWHGVTSPDLASVGSVTKQAIDLGHLSLLWLKPLVRMDVALG